MALPSTMVWRVRVGGNSANGGGFDPAISGAGTDYSQQDSPQVTFNGTTVTATTSGASATITVSGYTVATTDKGNILRISSGTNYTAGWYRIDSVNTGSNQWTLDRTCSSGSGSALVGRMGGAFAMPANLSTDSSGPLAAGHTVYVRGSGSSDPSSADYAETAYKSWAAGDTTSGRIRWIGENGRPFISTPGLFWYNLNGHSFQGLKLSATAGTYTSNGIISDAGGPHGVLVCDCIIDQAGFDTSGVKVMKVIGCEFRNTGSTSAGTYAAVRAERGNTGGIVEISGCVFKNWRGPAIQQNAYGLAVVDCIIANCKTDAITLDSNHACMIRNCTFDGGSGHAVVLSASALAVSIVNNIFSNHTGVGKYAIYASGVGSTTLGDRSIVMLDYNVYYNNTSDLYRLTAGSHDLSGTNPSYSNSGSYDFTPTNTALKGVALPTSLFGATNEVWIGAIQPVAAGGSSGARLVGPSSLVTPGGIA